MKVIHCDHPQWFWKPIDTPLEFTRLDSELAGADLDSGNCELSVFRVLELPSVELPRLSEMFVYRRMTKVIGSAAAHAGNHHGDAVEGCGVDQMFDGTTERCVVDICPIGVVMIGYLADIRVYDRLDSSSACRNSIRDVELEGWVRLLSSALRLKDCDICR